FSIGFNEKQYDEAPHAKAVARHLGTDHTELYVTATEALTVIPSLPDLYDEPFADSSQIPTYLVARLARRHVTVSLSGDGGDELFCGYTRYELANQAWTRFASVPAWAQKCGRLLISSFPPWILNRLLQAATPAVQRRRRSGREWKEVAAALGNPTGESF